MIKPTVYSYIRRPLLYGGTSLPWLQKVNNGYGHNILHNSYTLLYNYGYSCVTVLAAQLYIQLSNSMSTQITCKGSILLSAPDLVASFSQVSPILACAVTLLYPKSTTVAAAYVHACMQANCCIVMVTAICRLASCSLMCVSFCCCIKGYCHIQYYNILYVTWSVKRGIKVFAIAHIWLCIM